MAAELDKSVLPKPRPATFIQVGTLHNKKNVSRDALRLKQLGYHPQVRKRHLNGTQVYVLLVGPLAYGQNVTAVIHKLVTAGFDDTFFILNRPRDLTAPPQKYDDPKRQKVSVRPYP